MKQPCYENSKATQWYQSMMADPARFPFTFTYGGNPYEGFSLEAFTLLSCNATAGENRETTEFCWQLEEALTVTLTCTHYFSHGVTEWTVWFENPSDHLSQLLENPETVLSFSGTYPVLKGILGDHTNWYRPYAIDLTSMPVCYESNSGRATHVYFPYFNLEYGNEGTMLAIGWAGTWHADFRTDGACTTYRAGSVNGLCTCIKPGEKIRTALFVRADYTVRNENYATNYWRSWFVQCNLPPADSSGAPLAPFSTCCLASDTGLPNTDGSISERYTTWRPSLEKMIAEDVKVDFRWMDAGWYISPAGASPDGSTPDNDWWTTVGTWTFDPVKWPKGTFRESTDFAREHGMKTLLWFEPERVTDPESLVKNYGYRAEWAIRREGVGSISNNIGDPECYQWTLTQIKNTLTENRIDMYREDNNSDPAGLWKYLDEKEGENRHGITECKFIDAHYRMWDEIIACTKSYGGCGFVDSCASGGGRNDLESMRRGIPMLRSDYDRTTTAIRLSMTTAFNKWIPFCGANTKEKLSQLAPTGNSDPYIWRASYLAALNVDSQFVQDPDQDFDILRFGLKEWKRVNPYLLKDYYVLTPWHTEEETTGFTSYSYFDPEQKKGVLLAFRQEHCEEDRLSICLPYVGENEICTLTDEDSGEVYRLTGADMQQKGCTLYFDKPRTARLLWVTVTSD